MSCMADAEIEAVRRACAGLDPLAAEDFTERYFAGLADAHEVGAVRRELQRITRADIGRPDLPLQQPAAQPLVILGPGGDFTRRIMPEDV